jgi:predicted  nucleic acid-binding Zn-ribbon protein
VETVETEDSIRKSFDAKLNAAWARHAAEMQALEPMQWEISRLEARLVKLRSERKGAAELVTQYVTNFAHRRDMATTMMIQAKVLDIKYNNIKHDHADLTGRYAGALKENLALQKKVSEMRLAKMNISAAAAGSPMCVLEATNTIFSMPCVMQSFCMQHLFFVCVHIGRTRCNGL